MKKKPEDSRNILWEATLDIDGPRGRKNSFLFRDIDDVSAATKTAVALADASPGVEMINSRIVKVERVARLWN